MKRIVSCINKKLSSFVTKCNGNRFTFHSGVPQNPQNFQNYQRHLLNKVEKGSLSAYQQKSQKYYSKSGNILFYISLICFPLVVSQQLHNVNRNKVSCMSTDKSTKGKNVGEGMEKLERVFLMKKNAIKKGQMVEVRVHNETESVLLIHMNDKYYCLGPKCPHYSAPLKDGLLTEKYVTCPWHDAKFDVQTGECLNGPSFDDIPSFKVEAEGDSIYAYLPKEIHIGKEKKVCSCKDRCEKKTILIVGGGAATLGAIESLLKNNFSGNIIVCSKDSHKPYDRTTISKSISNFSNIDELYESIKLKADEYYKNNNITYINDVTVTKVDNDSKKAYLDNGKVISFDKVLIASGLRPRSSPIKLVKNVQPNNLFNIYSLKDNLRLSQIAKEGSRCVILGSSFIGCELASALRKKKVNVTMVTLDKVPFMNVFGEKIGNVVLNVLKENDVHFYGSIAPTEYILDERFFKLKKANLIHGVKLANGEVLSCDFVIEAMGFQPNSDCVDSKFKNERNFIVTDKHFKVKGAEDMYAAGDVCAFPYFFTDELLNICHWNVAIQQGRIAAHNMLNNNKQEFRFLPFFNTNIMGNNFRMCGFASMYDKLIYEGDLSKRNFVVFFVRNDKVISILTLGNSKMPALNECLTLNKVPKPYELEAGLKNSDNMVESVQL